MRRSAEAGAFRTVGADGTPTEVVLGETRADSCCPRLTQILTFDQPIPVVAGTKYAIVASYPDAPFDGSGSGQGAWLGSLTDGYRADSPSPTARSRPSVRGGSRAADSVAPI